ncbi:MAG: PDZ domain-containing protein, partial [Flavobacteriales bacterium]
TIVQDIIIEEGKDVDEILREMGLLDDLNQLEEGQTLEINIRKIDDESTQDYDIRIHENRAPSAFLGVTMEEEQWSNENSQGVRIRSVIEGSAAETAGLQPQDLILSINGTEMNSISDVVAAIKKNKPGDQIELVYDRFGAIITQTIALGTKETEEWNYNMYNESPEIFEWNDGGGMEEFGDFNFEAPEFFELNQEPQPFFGISPDYNKSDQGVRIGEVIENSSAEAIGVEVGDIILEFNNEDVQTFEQIADLIGSVTPGEEVKVKLIRGKKKMTLKGEMGQRECHSIGELRLFPDFQGMDEEGNVLYDFHLDMGDENGFFSPEQFEEIFDQLPNAEDLMEGLPNAEELMQELEGLDTFYDTSIKIEIQSLTLEEANQVNEGVNNAPLLRADTDLPLNSISFFPNPNSGMFNLNFQAAEEGQTGVFIYDQTGAVVYEEWITPQEGAYSNQIDISDQPSGAYYLQIIQNDKTFSKKVIKN